MARPFYERYTSLINEARVMASLRIPAEETRLANASFEHEFIRDLRRATDLEPTNLVYAANAMMVELLSADANFQNCDAWKRLSSDLQGRLQKYSKRLDDLTRSQDAAAAVGAHLVLAVTGIILFGDKAGAEKHCRCAVALDPDQDSSWEMLLVVLHDSQKYEACLAAALESLQHSASPRKQYVVAKSYAELKQWQKAEERIRIVLRSQPNDVRANLAMGVLLMKRSVDASTLAQASTYLKKAEKLIDDGAPEDLRLDYDFTMGTYWALRGEVERACCLFAELMKKHFKNSKRKAAREALEALK